MSILVALDLDPVLNVWILGLHLRITNPGINPGITPCICYIKGG
jgi:hypothetical protein